MKEQALRTLGCEHGQTKKDRRRQMVLPGGGGNNYNQVSAHSLLTRHNSPVLAQSTHPRSAGTRV